MSAHDASKPAGPILTNILACLDRGWYVTPLCWPDAAGRCACPKSHSSDKEIGKAPLLGKGYQDRVLHREEVERFYTQYPLANYGILLKQSHLLVTDADSLDADREAELLGVPPGPRARTGRGIHRYFHNGADVIGSTTKRGESSSLDIFSQGYVVGPGSLHRAGAYYTWEVAPEECSLEDAPAWAVALLRECKKVDAELAILPGDLPAIGLDTLAISPDARVLIKHGLHGDVSKYPSRSEAVFAVLTTLLRAGVSDTATLAGILLDPRYAISAKPREQGRAWVASEIARARAKLTNGNGHAPWPIDADAPVYDTRCDFQTEPEPPSEPERSDPTPSASRTPEEQPEPSPAPASFNRTDLGNAERLMRAYGDRLRYCDPWKKWLTWDGARWKTDHTQQVRQWGRDTVRLIYQEAAHAPTEKERKAIAQHAMTSERDVRMHAMISLAQMLRPVLPEHLDTDPWLFNVRNGTIDLRAGTLQPHNRDALITKLAPVTYDPKARCPLFEQFLSRILNGDDALRRYLQKAAGYSLSGDTSEQCLFLAYGGGANGKSTLMEIFRALFGDYAEQAAFATFLHQERDAVRNDLAKLRSARLVTAVEVDEGRRFAESLIKTLTGGDTVTARFLFSEYFDFKPQFKLWLAANHRPIIQGTDLAIWRRVRLIPFMVTIPDEEQDHALPAKLKAELPGILNWALAGCHAWQTSVRLTAPPAVKDATEGYRNEMDAVGRFLEEQCIPRPDITTPSRDLYAAYTTWCEANGEKPLTQMSFANRLKERGYENDRNTSTGKRAWKRIGLKFEES